MPKGQRTKQNGQIETSTGNQTVMQRSFVWDSQDVILWFILTWEDVS